MNLALSRIRRYNDGIMNNPSDIRVKLKQDALAIFQAGLDAVDPAAAVLQHCRKNGRQLIIGDVAYDLSGYRDIYLIGAGKAAAPMIAAMETLLGDHRSRGIAVVKYGHLTRPVQTTIMEAGHPVPDENGIKAARAMINLVQQAGRQDLVICVLSGGGSALLPLPAPPISLSEKQQTVQTLLSCGATISEINAIRKHISAIKGGLLARAAHPAAFVSLILSDVVGDDLDVIASGPSVPDASTFAGCMEIVQRYELAGRLPPTVLDYLQKGLSGEHPETPKAGDPVFATTRNHIVGSSLAAVRAAKQKAEELGYAAMILSSMIEGETREVARVHAAIAKEIIKNGHPLASPACVLSGGETTVTLTGNGKGGRNQEFALAAAIDIQGWDNLVVFSAGTDGTDGPTDAAGAIADGTTVNRAHEKGRNARRHLADHDAYPFFQAIDDLVITGPTRTNVMDLRIILTRQRP